MVGVLSQCGWWVWLAGVLGVLGVCLGYAWGVCLVGADSRVDQYSRVVQGNTYTATVNAQKMHKKQQPKHLIHLVPEVSSCLSQLQQFLGLYCVRGVQVEQSKHLHIPLTPGALALSTPSSVHPLPVPLAQTHAYSLDAH